VLINSTAVSGGVLHRQWQRMRASLILLRWQAGQLCAKLYLLVYVQQA